MTNPQIENLEKVATILARVPEKFVFTGGGTIVLYVDEIVRDELRPTKDVDCVVEIFSRTEYYRFLQLWFRENLENLEDAVANFLPSSSASREERAIGLIQNFATD
jgi:hypothetical protein